MSDSQIESKQLPITIQRGRHSKEHPYVMISKEMLRDKDLSPKAKGFLCYLLSLPDTWKIYPRQLASELGIGRDQVYSVLSELLRVGYAYKTETRVENGRFSTVVYEFYEDRLPEEQRFKEKIPVSGTPDKGKPDTGNPYPGNPDTVNPDTETPPLVNIYYTEDKEREDRKKDITPPIPPQNSAAPKPAEAGDENLDSSSKKKKKLNKEDFSPEIREFTQKMLDSLKRAKPDCLLPNNLVPMMTAVDFMLRLDKRDPIKLMDVFNWALADSFWSGKMFKPNPADYLRKQFDSLDKSMNPPFCQKERKFAPSSDDARALETMRKFSEGAI